MPVAMVRPLTRRHHFDDCADAGAGLADIVEIGFPTFRRRGVGAPEWIVFY